MWIELVRAGRSAHGRVENHGGEPVGRSGRPWMDSGGPRFVHSHPQLSPPLSPGVGRSVPRLWGCPAAAESPYRVTGGCCAHNVGNLWNPRGQGCGRSVDSLWARCGRFRRRRCWETCWHCGQSAHTMGKPACVSTIFTSFAKRAYVGEAAKPCTRASDSPNTTKGRPQCVDAPKSLRDKGMCY